VWQSRRGAPSAPSVPAAGAVRFGPAGAGYRLGSTAGATLRPTDG